MTLDEFLESTKHGLPPDPKVYVRLMNQDMEIDYVEVFEGGLRIYPETYSDYDLDEANRSGQR
jgi:hypothetical protein